MANRRITTVVDLEQFSQDLAGFLGALRAIGPADGPVPGAHNFHRGGSLTVYDDETRKAIDKVADEIDAHAAIEVWDKALSTSWQGPPVWIHGDISSGNLLVKDGRLCAVIDFGCLGIGDPSCDLVIAWTFLGAVGREKFRAATALDPATWERARGWAIWKALIGLPQHRDANPAETRKAHRVLNEILR